jgi:hypothetical protein
MVFLGDFFKIQKLKISGYLNLASVKSIVISRAVCYNDCHPSQRITAEEAAPKAPPAHTTKIEYFF